jgi:hypothetical protein
MQRRSFLKMTGVLPTLTTAQSSHTEVSIRADQFFLNGLLTYRGRTYKGMKIEGLLMNVRAVQAAFDDLNPVTRSRWAYPDTHKWDPERNTREFLGRQFPGFVALKQRRTSGGGIGMKRQPSSSRRTQVEVPARQSALERLRPVILLIR